MHFRLNEHSGYLSPAIIEQRLAKRQDRTQSPQLTNRRKAAKIVARSKHAATWTLYAA